MGIIESTIAFLFRPKAPKHTESEHRQRTAAILRPVIDQAEDVARCLIDEPEKKANDKTATPDRR